jgi:hypothetical protein
VNIALLSKAREWVGDFYGGKREISGEGEEWIGGKLTIARWEGDRLEEPVYKLEL